MTSRHIWTTPGSSCGFKLVAAVLLILYGIPAAAQRRVSADLETKQVWQGKSVTTTKSVYCASNGRLVVVSDRPVEYREVKGAKGDCRIYFPQTNQVIVDNEGRFSSGDELIVLFFNGRADDLGLAMAGYRFSSAAMEDGLLKRTYVSDSPQNFPKAEIVYENHLPIYCGYVDSRGRTVSKTYLSRYAQFGRLTLPCRVTTVSYTDKGDSTVTRTLYSNVTVDGDSAWFDYEIPPEAKSMSLKDAARQLSGSVR